VRHHSAEEGPRDERDGNPDPDDHEGQITPVCHPPTTGIHSHTGTVGARYRTGAGVSMRMLFARAALAARARSQSGSSVRRTRELCASHVAVHELQVNK